MSKKVYAFRITFKEPLYYGYATNMERAAGINNFLKVLGSLGLELDDDFTVKTATTPEPDTVTAESIVWN